MSRHILSFFPPFDRLRLGLGTPIEWVTVNIEIEVEKNHEVLVTVIVRFQFDAGLLSADFRRADGLAWTDQYTSYDALKTAVVLELTRHRVSTRTVRQGRGAQALIGIPAREHHQTFFTYFYPEDLEAEIRRLADGEFVRLGDDRGWCYWPSPQ